MRRRAGAHPGGQSLVFQNISNTSSQRGKDGQERRKMDDWGENVTNK